MWEYNVSNERRASETKQTPPWWGLTSLMVDACPHSGGSEEAEVCSDERSFILCLGTAHISVETGALSKQDIYPSKSSDRSNGGAFPGHKHIVKDDAWIKGSVTRRRNQRICAHLLAFGDEEGIGFVHLQVFRASASSTENGVSRRLKSAPTISSSCTVFRFPTNAHESFLLHSDPSESVSDGYTREIVFYSNGFRYKIDSWGVGVGTGIGQIKDLLQK